MNLFDTLKSRLRSMRTMHKMALVVLVLGCFVGIGCPAPPMSTECRTFFSRPASERETLFRTYDLEKQLDFYRCGMNRRPPASSLSLLIAERGEAAIPILMEKLETEKDELFQYAIIDIFEVMSVKGYLRARTDVINRIRQVVARMKISTFREMAQKDLEQIEKNTQRAAIR